jgi:asparagine synthase (glutamine-hydrolysing)
MCGIAGIVQWQTEKAPPNTLQRLKSITDAMSSRGPDDEGIHQGDRYLLGHRRLKIIDLSDRARQPMIDHDLELELVFNGAIYNYQELRRELEQRGYRFFSDSDSEVIIKAYHYWKEDCVRRFNGMFAFCIIERQTGMAFLARDRLGIKPLYYLTNDGELVFASSLPALVKACVSSPEINPAALHYYLMLHSIVPAPETIFRDVFKLPPATVMTIAPDGDIRQHRYWSLSFATPQEKQGYGEPEWLEELDSALQMAVSRRLVADVPVGVLLSGGLDSSLITALVAGMNKGKLDTFSIGFQSAGGEAGNEFPYSDLVAAQFGTRHHQVEISAAETLAAIPETVAAMNEPMVSHDNVGFHLVSREVSRHVKVVQSGQGADEIFAGYGWYPPLQAAPQPVNTYINAFFDRDMTEYRETVTHRWLETELAHNFVARSFAEPGADDPVDKALRLDATVMLVEDPVKRVDSQTMAWGLEARVPFLDHELVELAAQMPSALKLAQNGKGVLKTLARRYLPDEVIDRPKGYFPVPALKYLSGPQLALVRDALYHPAAKTRSLFNPAYVDRLLKAPEAAITPLGGSKLWQLGLLEIWLQQHGF